MKTPNLTRLISGTLIFTLLLTSAYPLITRADDSAPAADPQVTVTDSTTPDTTAQDTTGQDATAQDTTTPSTAPDISQVTASTTAALDLASTTIASITSTTSGIASTTGDLASTTDTTGSTTLQVPGLDFTSIGSTTEATTTNTNIDEDASTTATSTDEASSSPTILSGTAVALANILNIINTNFVNSTGSALLLNYVDPSGTIDLRNASSTLSTGAVCLMYSCFGSEGTTVNLASDGQINNGLVLNATSGGNTINMDGGTGTIGTGNAYAGLNLINLANTNIVNSNYLLVSLNAFQGVDGDIVFPSLTNFMQSLENQLGVPSDVQLTSNSTVSNNITSGANSGDNSTDATTSSITSGQANSSSNVFNQLNANMIGGSNVALLFRVQGDWTGQVFGAPAGLQWTTDPSGHVVLFNDASSTGGSAIPGSLTASSTAGINNNVSVVALSGQNMVNGADTALITTGNADASANVVNVANANIVGKNWIMAVINIFGDFKGNIDFGRPDLWVGSQVSAPNYVANGTKVTYTLTVINNGDADADQSAVTFNNDANHLAISNPSTPYDTDANGNPVWNLGTVPAGKAEQITFDATVQNASPGTVMNTTSAAAEQETDNNPTDNTDTVSLMATQNSANYAWAVTPTFQTVASSTADTARSTDLTVTRTAGSITASGSKRVAHEELTVYNPDNATSTAVVLHDVITGPSGNTMQVQAWDLGVVRPHEEVDVSYDAQFDSSASAGTYQLSSGFTDESNNVLRVFKNNGTIIVPAQSLGEVLGAAITNSHAAHPASPAPASTNTNLVDMLGTPTVHANGNSLTASADSAKVPQDLLWLASLLILLAIAGAAYRVYRERRG